MWTAIAVGSGTEGCRVTHIYICVGEYGGSGSREEPVSSCGTAPPPRLGDHTTEVRGDCC